MKLFEAILLGLVTGFSLILLIWGFQGVLQSEIGGIGWTLVLFFNIMDFVRRYKEKKREDKQ